VRQVLNSCSKSQDLVMEKLKCLVYSLINTSNIVKKRYPYNLRNIFCRKQSSFHDDNKKWMALSQTNIENVKWVFSYHLLFHHQRNCNAEEKVEDQQQF